MIAPCAALRSLRSLRAAPERHAGRPEDVNAARTASLKVCNFQLPKVSNFRLPLTVRAAFGWSRVLLGDKLSARDGSRIG